MGVTNMQNKLISNREMFRQLLARDILAVLEEFNGGTCMRLIDIKQQLQGGKACMHYMDLHTSNGHGYLSYNDRFFRAIQSINDTGYGISIRKHTNGQLWAFSTQTLKHDNWQNFLAECFREWTADYNMNAGYKLNAQLDEAVA
jgi:hypothetical protein